MRPATVFVVDDQRPFRVAARTLVERTAGFLHVGDAATGEEALAVLAAAPSPPDLVLMDVRLPNMSGIDTTTALRDEHPSVVVVLCSTYDRADLPPGLEECGAAAFVRKEQLSPQALRALWTAHRP